ELVEGNLVLDVKVPEEIVPKDFAKHKAKFEEISEMRYTAATCGPDDFMRFKYSLCPALYQRHTKLSIVMTMYTESEVLFINTMNADDIWGPSGWQEVVVCVVSDGRGMVKERTLQVLGIGSTY
ncbi:chitin synthase N-terminal-domain-containing protein, partial [Mycena leptocephala]